MIRKNTDVVTTVFWIIVVFFLDPGGFWDANFRTPLGKLIISYGFVSVAWICYNIKKQQIPIDVTKINYIKKYTRIMIVWYIFYLGWFYGLNNKYLPGFLQLFTHNYRMISQGLLVIPLIYFTIISLEKFVKITTNTTIIVLTLLFITIITPFKIVETQVYDRIFIQASRYFMLGDGLIYFSLTIAITFFVLKLGKSNKILTAGIMVVIFIFVTLTRRSVVAIFEYIFIISILAAYIYKKNIFVNIIRFLKLKYIVLYVFIILFLQIIGFSFVNVSSDFLLSSFKLVTFSASETETDENRLSLTQNIAIVKAINDHFWFGTGFDPEWQSGDAGEKGWEGADFLFLSNFAMYGLIGLFLFIPFYSLTFKIIINCLRLIRANIELIIKNKDHFVVSITIFIAAASEFFKNLIEYPNWFYPIGMVGDTARFFIFFGFILGTFITIKQKLIDLKNLETVEEKI